MVAVVVDAVVADTVVDVAAVFFGDYIDEIDVEFVVVADGGGVSFVVEVDDNYFVVLAEVWVEVV